MFLQSPNGPAFQGTEPRICKTLGICLRRFLLEVSAASSQSPDARGQQVPVVMDLLPWRDLFAFFGQWLYLGFQSAMPTENSSQQIIPATSG